MDGRPEPSQAGARRAGHGRSSRDGTKSRKQRVPGTTRQHIALNKQILGSEHEQELSALVNERHSDFNGVNLASAYTKLLLGKFSGPPSRRGPNELGSHECELALAVLEVEMTKNTTVFGARECANLLHAVAKSQRQPCKPSLLPSLQVRVDQVAPDLTAQGIANVFWANAKMGIRPGSGVVEALTRRSQALDYDFNAQDVSNILWALATLRTNVALADFDLRPQSRLVMGLLERVSQCAPTMGSQAIGNTMWSLATLGLALPAESWERLEARALLVTDSFKPQELSNFLWAMARLKLQPSAALVSGLLAATEARAPQFKPQEIGNSMWAFASMGVEPSDHVLAAIGLRAEEVASSFSAQNCANVLWAFGTLRIQPSPALVAALFTRAEEVVGDFNSQNIANLIWACEALAIPPNRRLLEALTQRATTLGNLLIL